MDNNNSKRNRRYRLHVKLKKAKIKVISNKKTIFFPTTTELSNDDIKELVSNYNYSLQYTIE